MQIHSEVGSDGVLNLSIDLGPDQAANAVLVTIQTDLKPNSVSTGQEEWHRFVDQTYGSCAGLGLERPPQPALEVREPIE